MVDRERRRFLVTAGSIASGVAVAGCSGSSPTDSATTPNEPDTVGDVAAVNGIEITFADFAIQRELTYVPRGEDEVTIADQAESRDTRTIRAGEGRQFLVLVLRVSNVSSDPKGVPVPGGSVASEGEIYLEVDRTRRRPVPVNPERGGAVGGAYQHDRTWMDRLTLALGAHQAELPPETSTPGWILYVVSESFDPGEAILLAETNPEGPARSFNWSFTD